MTFSEKIKTEFCEEVPPKACCRRALSHGMLFDADVSESFVSADTQCEEGARLCRTVLSKREDDSVRLCSVSKCGRTYHRVEADLPRLGESIAALDSEGASVGDYVEFKCPLCRVNFLRGIFIFRATLSFEPGNNHLEFRIRHPERARVLADYLTRCGVAPRSVKRGGGVGLYYKKADSIEDILNLMQANDTLFDVINKRIERDIVIQENRAVNCESVNIMRSVEGAQKQLRAIEIIRGAGMLDKLDAELRESAYLRLENHSASLSELAAMHEGNISKSVLNGRFAKIIKISESILKREKDKTNGGDR